jgi:penicillin amidase
MRVFRGSRDDASLSDLARSTGDAVRPARPGFARRLARRALIVSGLALGLLVIVAAAASVWLWSRLERSLPAVDGEIAVPCLRERVVIERDALGVPTVRAADRLDLARATGFLHAQERYFQMDLLRRSAAGELSELMGSATLEWDRSMRAHGAREVSRRILEAHSGSLTEIVEAYTEGVNDGLAALGSPPFEYALLLTEPEPWLPEDTALAVLAMFYTLHEPNRRRESDLGVMQDILPGPLFDLLTTAGTEWDAPIQGPPLATPPLPGPEVVDLRRVPRRETATALRLPHPREDDLAIGSNNWAVSGDLSAHGGAILANDMHLRLSVPNPWYRMSFVWPGSVDDGTDEHRVTGVTLPGGPAIIVGSNGRVAWGFTNTEGDWSDLVILEVDPQDPDRYLTPDGYRSFEHREERIEVRGGRDETVEVKSTIWGPVIDRDYKGRPRALHWTGLTGGVNMGLLRMENARDLDEAILFANMSGAPPQNVVIADSAGRIGWTVLGQVPRRFGFDGHVPQSWADGTRGWSGWLAPEEYPRVVDPPGGRLWTANNRVVDGEALAKIGDGGQALGARARQIRDDLATLDAATETDLLAIQLDDRALLLSRWRDLILEALTSEAVAADPRRAEFRRLVQESWTGRASVDSVGYALVRAYRLFLSERVLEAITAPCREADPRFEGFLPQSEGPVWKIIAERPPNLLDPRFDTWDEMLLDTVDSTIEYLTRDGSALADRSWGRRNVVQVQHALSLVVPFLGRWLDMPPQPLPGDTHMPRVQGPGVGASERMVVSPGREELGIFHMPGGQSGHPLSPNYGDGHEAWAHGEPTPFLPGPPAHTLTLLPE